MKESEKDSSLQAYRFKVKLEVYRQYRELARNEDRLFNERLLIFLTAHSILFAGYIMSFQFVDLSPIRIILPIVGIVLCFVGFFLAFPAMQTWLKWIDEITGIEDNLKKINPHLQFPEKARGKLKPHWVKFRWTWIIGTYCLPLIFLFLWGFSLFFIVR